MNRIFDFLAVLSMCAACQGKAPNTAVTAESLKWACSSRDVRHQLVAITYGRNEPRLDDVSSCVVDMLHKNDKPVWITQDEVNECFSNSGVKPTQELRDQIIGFSVQFLPPNQWHRFCYDWWEENR
ncbi:MAG: hypothetical protein R3E66_22585 [bacterium]